MSRVTLQSIKGLRLEDESRYENNSRLYERFCDNINKFFIYLCCEYALQFNLNTDTELYKNIRLFMQNNLDVKGILNTIKKDERLISIVSSLENIKDDVCCLKKLLEETTWEYTEEKSIFYINGNEFICPNYFLELIESNGDKYVYIGKYIDETYYIIPFNIKKTDGLISQIEKDDPFVFYKETANFNREERVPDFNITEKEFFEIEGINSADNEQREAIKSDIDNNLLVLAGAGSGKTMTLVNRLVYLHVIKRIPLSRMVLLTFTKNAADNMKRRCENILKRVYNNCGIKKRPNVIAKTIDAFFYSMIKDNYKELGFSKLPEMKLGDFEGIKHFVDSVIKSQGLLRVFSKYYNKKTERPNDSFKYLVRNLESLAYGMDISQNGLSKLLDEVVKQQIKDAVIYDFVYANIIVKETIIDQNSIFHKLILNGYDCILMDEFQDVNILQNQTFEVFYDSKIHFTFVGDDDQSIYGWRGSNNTIICNLVSEPNVKTIYLLSNYRNNPNIVKAGNAILSRINGRAKKDRAILPKKKDGGKIVVASCDDKYVNIANEVERITTGENAYNVDDVCVLTRNKDDRDKLFSALTAIDIPVVKEILRLDINSNYKQLKAIISILNDYEVTASCREIKRINNIDETNMLIKKIVCGKNVVLQENNPLIGVKILADEVRNFESSSMANIIELYSLKAGEILERKINVKHSDPVFEMFELYCSNNNAPWPISKKQLKEIFTMFESITSRERQISEHLNGVRVSTIHSAKGLEYKVVIITGLTEGEYPDTRIIDAQYNEKLNELEILKNVENDLKLLRGDIPKDRYNSIIEECHNSIYNSTEKEFFSQFKDNLYYYSSVDINNLTATGVDDYLDMYREFIEPMINSYKSELVKIKDKGLHYREQQITLMDDIDIYQEGGEGDSDDCNKKKSELKVIDDKINKLLEEYAEKEKKYICFMLAIDSIYRHYQACVDAKNYFADIKKADDIESLKEKLQQEKDYAINEEKRLFYVALTRAKDLLYLCYDRDRLPSQFITIIPDELKEEKLILTKEDQKEFERLQKSLKDVVSKEEVNVDLAQDYVNKIVDNDNFKTYLKIKLDKFYKQNKEFEKLEGKAKEFFEQGIKLKFIGEYAKVDFSTEFAHNMQRTAEELLLVACDKIPTNCSFGDKMEEKRAIKEIVDITKKCCTNKLDFNYVSQLLSSKDWKSDKLKSAGVYYYVLTSGEYNCCSDNRKIFAKRVFLANRLLCAIVDISNIRNYLIHPNKTKDIGNVYDLLLSKMKIVCISVKEGNIIGVEPNTTFGFSVKSNTNLSSLNETNSYLRVGAKVKRKVDGKNGVVVSIVGAIIKVRMNGELSDSSYYSTYFRVHFEIVSY